ncbi:SHOCT domain-containing protein [Chloroflexota bacterium]
MLIFGGGLIALIIWGITRLTRRDESTAKHTPLEIAKERYAKGEINKEQFEQIKKDLY